MSQTDSETSKGNLISKITGLFRSRNSSPEGDLDNFEEEEKFEWDPVTKKWVYFPYSFLLREFNSLTNQVSNISGPAQPPPPPIETSAPVRRPPPRPNLSISSHPPRNSLGRTQITTRYALEDQSYQG